MRHFSEEGLILSWDNSRVLESLYSKFSSSFSNYLV